MRSETGQTLLIDADDTLWENNIYFERAIAQFIEHAAPSNLTVEEIRHRFDDEERRALRERGYGSRSFAIALQRTWRAVMPAGHSTPSPGEIERLALAILDMEIELLPGVDEALRLLGNQHDLFLVTKGDRDEQQAKVARSGLADRFTAAIIVDEKSVSTYRDIVEEFRLDEARTWMIGNSIRSDINPAVQAGLNAIFIPHPDTWHMEHAELEAPDGVVLTLDRFTDIPAALAARQ